MSASLHAHHHPGRSSWTVGTPRPGAPVVAGLRDALRAALLPGSASSSAVPALHARDAQALLVRSGELDADRTSARWDRPTTDAVAAFQRHRGLPCTGVADQRTADALMALPGPVGRAGAGRAA